jgi:hypothetical protein
VPDRCLTPVLKELTMNADEPPRTPDKAFGEVLRSDRRGAHRPIDDALDELAASVADEIEGKRIAVFQGKPREAAIISWQRNGYVWHSCYYDGVRWQTVQGHYEYKEESAAREAALAYLGR